MSRNSIIKVENLSKTFVDKKVLKGISFNVNKGESFVVIGGSGSGKSVLIKCLAGFLIPDFGSGINIYGEEVAKLHLSKRKDFANKFSMLFQSNALFDSLTVWENICFKILNNDLLGIDDAKELALEKLKLVGLDETVMYKNPSKLSVGMQKRVGIARAIATTPEIIFLDEPTSGLDPILSATIAELIKSLSKKLSTTTITITHDINVMRKIADKVALLKEGEMIWVDTLKNTVESKDKNVQFFLNQNKF